MSSCIHLSELMTFVMGCNVMIGCFELDLTASDWCIDTFATIKINEQIPKSKILLTFIYIYIY